MASEEWPTNLQVFNHYLKGNQHSLTDEYCKLFPPSSGGYNQVISDFKRFSETHTPSTPRCDNYSLYQILTNQGESDLKIFQLGYDENKINYANWHSVSRNDAVKQAARLCEVEEINLVDNATDQNQDTYRQKWHLYVAILGFNLLCGYDTHSRIWMLDYPNIFWNGSFFKCPGHGYIRSQQLKLWMIENSSNEDVKHMRDTLKEQIYSEEQLVNSGASSKKLNDYINEVFTFTMECIARSK